MYENVLHHGCVDDLLCGFDKLTEKRGSYYYNLVETLAKLRQVEQERDAMTLRLIKSQLSMMPWP
jgi:hypothetical protein